MEKTNIVITGASGLLGRALMTKFSKGSWKKVIGTAFSRSGENLIKVDLTDTDNIDKFIQETKPDVLIHSAAQRFPDQIQKNPESARKLNVDATMKMAASMKKIGGKMLYISTDYVFDGRNPPYQHDSSTNPLNDYGIFKLEGEKVVLDQNEENLVLRIPILYGDVEYLDESAITTLFKKLLDPSQKAAEMSDYEIRRPSHVTDIASVVHDLILRCVSARTSQVEDEIPKGVYQWCGSEALTKYDMIKIMADQFGLDFAHIKPLNGPSPGAPRPYDTTMDTSRLSKFGIRHHTPFAEGIKSCLEKWNKQ